MLDGLLYPWSVIANSKHLEKTDIKMEWSVCSFLGVLVKAPSITRVLQLQMRMCVLACINI